MKQIDELLGRLTEKLDDQMQTAGAVENMPNVPLMMLYMGERACDARNDITSTLRQVWRKRADAALQMTVKDRGFYRCSEDGEQELFSEKDFQHEVDDLYAREENFNNMNNLFLIMIFDTRDYENVESFGKSYESVEEIRKCAGWQYCLSMSIIFLDESAAGSELSREIRQYLRKQLDYKTNPYQSVFLISNRLYNGALLVGERKKENYDLAGTVILLANSCSKNYKPPAALLFPSGNDVYYLTAAFSRVRRPNRKICEIILNRVLQWSDSCLGDAAGLSLEELCARLEISGNSAKEITEFYKREIRPVLPQKEDLEYLPRASKNVEQLCAKPYQVFEQETMGCGEIFYQQQFVPCIKEAIKKFGEEFRKYLFRMIKAGEALKITDAMIDNVVEQLKRTYPSDNTPAYQYFTERAEVDFTVQVLPVCIEEIRFLRNAAKDYIFQFKKVIEEFREDFFIDSDEENIRNYYDRLTQDFLAGQKSDKIRKRLMGMDGTRKSLIGFLRDTMIEILESDQIFTAPLVDEMTLRMGADPVEIQQTLKNELLNDIEGKMRLRTLTSLPMLQETFIVSQKDADGKATMFFKYLQQLREGQVNAGFFDSGNSNSIGVLRMYRCDSDSLI